MRRKYRGGGMSPKLVQKCRGVTEKGRKTKKSRGGGIMRRKCRGGGSPKQVRKCRVGSPKKVGRQKNLKSRGGGGGNEAKMYRGVRDVTDTGAKVFRGLPDIFVLL